MKVYDLELINNINILLENKIILYGASEHGKSVYKLLKDVGIDIFGYCDSDSKKWGTEILGKKVFSPDELAEIQDRNTIIIITSDWFREILNNLEENYNIKCNIYTTFGLKYSLFNNSEKLKEGKKFAKHYKMWYMIKRNWYGHGIMKFSIDCTLNVCDRGDILILQPGKVGSSSVLKSILSNKNNKLKVCHNHGLLCSKDEVKEYLDETRKNKKIKIISLCREPISRDISLLFEKMSYIYKVDNIISEKLEDYYFNFLKRQYCCKKIPENKNLCDEWFSLSMNGGEKRNLYGYFGWFDSEFKKVFDIDILKYKFDKEKGYVIIKENNVELLLLKLEKLNDISKVIGDFLELDNFKLLDNNVSDKKIYKYAYNDFKKSVKLPRAYVDLYYKNNKYMDYFYSEKEKEEFYAKWKKFIV